MGILSTLIVKSGIKGLGLAAGAAGSVVGAASGLAKGIASGIKGAADAAASADKEPESTNTVINNFGMVGAAGAQKVKSGTGTLPATKKAAKPAYNEKMSTEKLLTVVVGYLASIDDTIRAQIDSDKNIYQKKVQAEREASIENKNVSVFEGLGDKLGFMDKKPSSSVANKILAGGALIAALGAIGISKLDTTELDALKANVEAFKTEYSWLVDMASFVGVGGFLGFLKGGIKGGLVGIVAEYIFDKLYHSELNPYAPKDENGNPIQPERSIAKGALIAGFGAYGMAKAGMKVAPKIVAGKMRSAAASAGTRSAIRTGTAWFATKIGKRFLKKLALKVGISVMKRIATALAGLVGGVLMTATGVGAIFGIAQFIFSAGVLIYGIYDVASAIWDAWNEAHEEEKTAAAVQNAVAVSGNTATGTTAAAATPSTGIVSKSETGKPEEAQAFFESKGWTKEQAAGIVGNLFVESGLRTDAEGDGGKAYGIAQWHPDRQAVFQKVYNKHIRQSNFYEQLEYVNWELNNSEKKAGAALRGATTAQEAAAIVDKKYERSSGAAIAQRQANATAISGGDYANLQGGGGGASEAGGFDAGSALSMGKNIFGKAGGALVGSQNYGAVRPITENIGNPSKKIQDMSKQIETATIAGMDKKVEKSGPIAALASQKSIMQASNDGTLGALDPNYPGGKDLIMTYLAHWKVAA